MLSISSYPPAAPPPSPPHVSGGTPPPRGCEGSEDPRTLPLDPRRPYGAPLLNGPPGAPLLTGGPLLTGPPGAPLLTGGPLLEQRLNATLQELLKELDLPETLTMMTPPPPPPPRGGAVCSDVCICVLGSPAPYISLLLEAGHRSPGDALLCLSPSWLSSPASSSSLLVHKAVTFDLGGRTFLATFNPPRLVTYFLSCDPYQEVMRGVGCPMGGSGALNRFWSDVLTTRLLMEKAGIPTPPTLALLLAPPSGESQAEPLGPSSGHTEVVHLVAAGTEQLDLIRTKMDHFLESEPVKKTDRVVVRLSGGRFADPGHQGVVLHYVERSSSEELWSRMLQNIPRLLPGEAVLLEAFCSPLRPGARVQTTAWDHDVKPEVPDVTFRVCAVVTRNPQDVPLLYKLVCRVGGCDRPLSHSQSVCQSLESCLSALGLTDPALPVCLRRLACRTALDCLRVVMEAESTMSAERRGGAAAQSDMMGVDLVFTEVNSVVGAVVLGLHPSLCLHRSVQPADGAVGAEPEGEERWDSETEAQRGTVLLAPLVRSQRYLMEDRTVLVVGAGSHSKRFIWEAARRYKIKLLLVDGDPNHFASRMVDGFLALPDLPDHRRDAQHCARILDWLRASALRPHGCVCFWDDCVVLASLVCDRLGLRGPPPAAVCVAKEKSCTHLHLLHLTRDTEETPRTPEHLQGLLRTTWNQEEIPEHLTGTKGHHRPVSVQEPGGQADSQADQRTMRRGVEMEGHTLAPPPPPITCCSSLAPPPPSSSLSPGPGSVRASVPLLSPSPASYAVPCVHVETPADLLKAGGAVRYPAVMKLEYGAGAVGVRKVCSLEESLLHMERIAGDLREETDYPGIGLGWGNAMTLMEYVGGTEHDVDLVLFDGRLEGAFVSDNGPTRAPGFTETAAQMPSGLSLDRRAQLIRAAHHACLGVGLRDGVFNAELKMTPAGPRLIEINARMGGFYLRDWILELYGVDLLLSALAAACGVRPRLPSAAGLPARGHFAGVMVVVSQHLGALKSTASPARLRVLHQEGALWLNELAADDELISGEYEEPFCNVGVRDGRSGRDARARLLALCQALGLHRPPRYDLEYFLSHFS